LSGIAKNAHVKETEKDNPEAMLASFWYQKFRESMIAKSDYTKRWLRYIDAYNGEYFKSSKKADYKSDLVSNYIFSIIETIRPIMLDNDPKFQAVPRQPEGRDYSNDLHEAFQFEWDRESMSPKLYQSMLTALITGTSIYFVPWDSANKQVKSIPVNVFNFFQDPLATCMDDADYAIYATYMHEGVARRTFPNHANKLIGGQINYSELVQGNDQGGTQISNQILMLEVWAKDWTFDEIEEGGFTRRTLKYPRGRVLTIAPELNLVLSDKENPYQDGKFPFILFKDFDIPFKFWGEGEIAQLLSPQTYMNEMNNAVIDNAKHTANVPWIIDKNSGIGQGSITNRPGLIIRKNPGTTVERPQPPSMPAYVNNAIADLKGDMEQISGVFDTLKGNAATGVYTAQGILALQEAGQARIRLKVKLLESSLAKLGSMWHSRMKQFWKEDRWVRTTKPDGTYDFRVLKRAAFDHEYDIKITAGSTIAVNRGAMLDLMVRLAQTQMPDGQPLVDREAVAQFLPEEVKATLLRRMGDKQAELEAVKEEVEAIGEQSTQGIEQLAGSLEEIVGSIEQLNNQILQLQKEHDSMIEKERKEKELSSARDSGYNQGFSDAEKQVQTQLSSEEELFSEDGAEPEFDEQFLLGLDQLTDDELALLVEKNPELVDLINRSEN
jgi:hypothetical protein